MFRQTLKLVVINAAVFLGIVLLLEGAAQVVSLVRPSYEVLFLQPDRILGWKQVPNLRWTWAGHHWYAADFTVNVKTNPLGFRDSSWPVFKKQDVKRIALLGDSFIEAVQVPLEKTAAHVLQFMLNAQVPQASQTWETLNFGISNYGVGQYLLAWEKYASQFNPDYVTIFVAKFHLQRTVNKYETGAFSSTNKKGLWVRPTFRMENGNLIREPARDFDDFVKLQTELIRTDFSGSRSRRRIAWITGMWAKKLRSRLAEKIIAHREYDAVLSKNDQDAQMFDVNSKIIRELGHSVARFGARLIVIDVSRYFGDDESVSAFLEDLCRRQDLGYIPLYKGLQKANANGVSTRWSHDNHFNETGNEILARSVYDWIQHDRNARQEDPATARLPSVRW